MASSVFSGLSEEVIHWASSSLQKVSSAMRFKGVTRLLLEKKNRNVTPFNRQPSCIHSQRSWMTNGFHLSHRMDSSVRLAISLIRFRASEVLRITPSVQPFLRWIIFFGSWTMLISTAKYLWVPRTRNKQDPINIGSITVVIQECY
jgi:hypothetical protein